MCGKCIYFLQYYHLYLSHFVHKVVHFLKGGKVTTITTLTTTTYTYRKVAAPVHTPVPCSPRPGSPWLLLRPPARRGDCLSLSGESPGWSCPAESRSMIVSLFQIPSTKKCKEYFCVDYYYCMYENSAT